LTDIFNSLKLKVLCCIMIEQEKICYAWQMQNARCSNYPCKKIHRCYLCYSDHKGHHCPTKNIVIKLPPRGKFINLINCIFD